MGYFLADSPPGTLILTPRQFMDLRHAVVFNGTPEELENSDLLEVPQAIEALSEILGDFVVAKAMRGYKPVRIKVDWANS